MLKLTFFGLACVAALWVATFVSGEGRKPAITAGAVMLINWSLTALPWVYYPFSPAFLLASVGIHVTAWDFFALTDLVSLVVIAEAGKHTWWSPVLWTGYLATLFMFSIAWAIGWQYQEYSAVLDAVLCWQLAVIFSIGGGGCASFVSDRCRRLRDLVRGPSRVFQAE